MQLKRISKLHIFIVFIATTLSLISCGKRYKAENIVKDFLGKNLQTSDINNVQFSKLDSTFYVSPNMVKQMREDAHKNPLYLKQINYESSVYTKKMFFIRIKYDLTTHDGKVHKEQQTFYLDKDLKYVISFKDN